MAEIKQKFYEKLENFEPDKYNSYSISRVDYETTMQRIIQMQDNIRKLVKKGTKLRYVCQEVKSKYFLL